MGYYVLLIALNTGEGVTLLHIWCHICCHHGITCDAIKMCLSNEKTWIIGVGMIFEVNDWSRYQTDEVNYPHLVSITYAIRN